MARFNRKAGVASKTVNLAGGEAFKESPKLEFATILLTSFVKDQFYRSGDETADRVRELLDKVDPLFAAKAAIYARTKYGMRSVTHLVAGELPARVKGQEWTKRFYDKVIYRPDDITEILVYYLNKFGKPVPNSLKKGLGTAFGKFDSYQLGKYRGEGHDLSLVDVVNLIHPKPNDKNSEALKNLVEGKLKSTQTWESKLTKAGQTAKTDEEKEEMKKEAWADLLKERKLGYFALLRNLRNIMEQAPEMVDIACEMLVEPEAIKKSLVLPFRFLTAVNEIKKQNAEGTRKVMTAISKAAEISLSNVPKFDGKTLVVMDISGSMESEQCGNLPVKEVAALFAGCLYKANDADIMVFSDTAEYVNPDPTGSFTSITNELSKLTGGGTDFGCWLQEANRPYDRIIVLSDMQGWVGFDAPTKDLAAYKKRTGANPLVYSFDLAGYGTLQFPESNVYCLAGFSEKTFDIMKMLGEDRNALVNEIEKVEI